MNVEPLDPEDTAAQALIAKLDEHLACLYLYERDFSKSVQSMTLPNVYFLGAYVNDELIGCGAVRTLEDDGKYGEIKKVFVADNHRGKGHSKVIMRELEAYLSGIGIGVARLTTGIKQPEAISLYTTLGYVQRSPYGSHAADPMTVFMEKQLGASCVRC